MASNDNLQAAFAGESQANRMYLAFAKKAEEDGYPGIAKLFRATAEAETVHAHSHFRVLGKIQGTAENLESAIAGEAHEYKEMYPEFVAEAEKEGNQQAAFSFKHAMAVEEIHHGFYSEALESLKAGKDIPDTTISICPVCGNTVKGGLPDKCPICGVPGERFFEVK
jgi:rubrerythrin